MEPVQISGRFRDGSGNVVFEIEENDIVFKISSTGDFDVVDNRFTYKLRDGRTALKFSLTPDEITIMEILHTWKDYMLVGDRITPFIGNFARRNRLSGNIFFSKKAIELRPYNHMISYHRADLSTLKAGNTSEIHLPAQAV